MFRSNLERVTFPAFEAGGNRVRWSARVLLSLVFHPRAVHSVCSVWDDIVVEEADDRELWYIVLPVRRRKDNKIQAA
uniref:Uncharacterized protein n=1 Tax=Daphnia galeata TaxID=27404 RepID=A0A8J2RQA0_9CRUS|nr:unnamed protein product [Daphnia galeata]